MRRHRVGLPWFAGVRRFSLVLLGFALLGFALPYVTLLCFALRVLFAGQRFALFGLFGLRFFLYVRVLPLTFPLGGVLGVLLRLIARSLFGELRV